MVYPGPADQLRAHAAEFQTDRQWPANFLYVLDPDYAFTNAYGLRWEAPRVTAYPSTFVIDPNRRVTFDHFSNSKGDCVSAAKALEVLNAAKYSGEGTRIQAPTPPIYLLHGGTMRFIRA
jgi:alkyl hydroperoxide reductase subunit AhpC